MSPSPENGIDCNMQSSSSSVSSILPIPSINLNDGWVAGWDACLDHLNGAYYVHNSQKNTYPDVADTVNTTQLSKAGRPVPIIQSYISSFSSIPATELTTNSQSLRIEIDGSNSDPPPGVSAQAESGQANDHALQSPSSALEGPDAQNVFSEDSTHNNLRMTRKRKRPTPKDPARFKHACDSCGERFTRSTTLREHARTHNGERPFPCSTCAKLFSRLKDRNRHEALHAGGKKFCCDLTYWGIHGACGRNFAREDGLAAHLRTDRGWKCLRASMDREVFWNLIEAKTRHSIGFTCKLTSLACQADFITFQHFKNHVREPANKGCVDEWLVKNFLLYTRNEQAWSEKRSSKIVHSEEQRPSGSREPIPDVQRMASRSPSPEVSRAADVQKTSELPSSGNHATEDRLQNENVTNEQDPHLAGQSHSDISPFASWVLVASGHQDGWNDRIWIDIKCSVLLDSKYLFRVGPFEKPAEITWSGEMTLDGYSSYTFRLKAPLTWMTGLSKTYFRDHTVKIVDLFNLGVSFPVGDLRRAYTESGFNLVLDSSAKLSTSVQHLHRILEERDPDIENAPPSAIDQGHATESQLAMEASTYDSSRPAVSQLISEVDADSISDPFSNWSVIESCYYRLRPGKCHLWLRKTCYSHGCIIFENLIYHLIVDVMENELLQNLQGFSSATSSKTALVQFWRYERSPIRPEKLTLGYMNYNPLAVEERWEYIPYQGR